MTAARDAGPAARLATKAGLAALHWPVSGRGPKQRRPWRDGRSSGFPKGAGRTAAGPGKSGRRGGGPELSGPELSGQEECGLNRRFYRHGEVSCLSGIPVTIRYAQRERQERERQGAGQFESPGKIIRMVPLCPSDAPCCAPLMATRRIPRPRYSIWPRGYPIVFN